MASKGKSAAKPAAGDPVVSELQAQLKREGFYAGSIDGKMGESTQAAVQAREAAKAQAEQRALERERLAQSAKQTDADVAAKAAETARAQRYQDNAASPLGMAAQSGANLLAPAAGTAIGMGMGKAVNYRMDRAQESRNQFLQGVAADRAAGTTTVEGARQGARLAGAMPSSNPLLRTAARMGSHIGLGAVSIGKGLQVYNDADPNGEFYPYQADRAAGLGYIGVGAGLLKQGIRQAAAPGVAPDAQALAIINSNQIRRNNQPAEAKTSRPALPGSRADMLAQAKRYNIAGRSTMTVEQLRTAVGEAVKSTPAPRGGAASKALKGLAGPAAAASIAYSMTPDRAEAADGSAIGGQAEALTNAGAAGGIAYGVNKLLPAVGSALGKAGTAMAPFAGADLSDAYAADDQQLARDRNWVARNVPGAGYLPGALGQAYDMAQVPERAPRDPFDEALSRFESYMSTR